MTFKRNKEDHRRNLEMSLRLASRNGTWRPGDMLPTVRELSEQHQVSARAVNQELRKLIDEGVIYTIPRVGTFVGHPSTPNPDFYLLIGPLHTPYGSALRFEQLRIGFEERVAQLGAASIVLPIDVALELKERGELPSLAGVFDFSFGPTAELFWKTEENVPLVSFATSATPELVRDVAHTDLVFFDDVDGGRQATHHLLQQGHQRIAFLGLHSSADTNGFFIWSSRRAQGWKEVLHRVGQSTDDLFFGPTKEPADHAEEFPVAVEVAKQIAKRRDITAIVVANDFAVMGICEALRQAEVPTTHWPSMVGFDERSEARQFVLTSLRLPWENVGKNGADLLWERKNGNLTGIPQERQVKMKLVARMTARKYWSANADRAIQVALAG